MFGSRTRAAARPQPVTEAEPPTVEVGSFAHGVCEGCEWRGPGRRARTSAIVDARAHESVCRSEPRLTA